MPAQDDISLEAAEERIEEILSSRSRTLDLSGLGLKVLPESVCQLAHLRNLYVHHNYLVRLPETIGRLSRLEVLDLSCNRLAALPESIGQLAQLQELNIYRNQLTALPESLGQLAQLQQLIVHHNQLTALPESLGRLTQLRGLYAYHNQLAALPESLGQLKQLRELSVSENQLTALPESVGRLVLLERLDVEKNRLSALPASLGQLRQLLRLDVSQNELAALPESIGQLTQLQRLSVSHNRLSVLPESLRRLDSLHTLLVEDNPELAASAEAAGPMAKEILRDGVPTATAARLDSFLQQQTDRSSVETTFTLAPGGSSAGRRPSALTPQSLATGVCPYLNALEDIQRLLDEIRGRPPAAARLNFIMQGALLSLSMTGVAEAVRLVKELIEPWRRDHEAQFTALASQAEEPADARLTAEDRLRAGKRKTGPPPADRKTDQPKLRLELQREELKLARTIVERVRPQFSDSDKSVYAAKLLPPLETVVWSGFEMTRD